MSTIVEAFIHLENVALHQRRLLEPYTNGEWIMLLKVLAQGEARRFRIADDDNGRGPTHHILRGQYSAQPR
jgi:hypothetical protein